jgi:hypothetical protein
MNKKATITISLILLLGLLGIMSWDLFFKTENQVGNQYEYKLDKLKQVDTNLLCYKEVQTIEISDRKIYGLAIDNDDITYVSAEGKVLAFRSNGDSLLSFVVSGRPNCITAPEDGNLYLSFKDHIEIWSKKGELISKWGTINSAAYITSIAVDENSVFLADAGNKIVHHYDKNGKLINQIGKRNKEKDILGFFIPSPFFDVLIGRDGELWAINTGRHTFEAYDKEGNLKSKWQRRSMLLDGFSGCCNPSHVAMLLDGSFVTSEKGIERVKIHHANGDLKCVVAKPNQFVEGTVGLDVAVDSNDRIYILDPEKKMVRIFAPSM